MTEVILLLIESVEIIIIVTDCDIITNWSLFEVYEVILLSVKVTIMHTCTRVYF